MSASLPFIYLQIKALFKKGVPGRLGANSDVIAVRKLVFRSKMGILNVIKVIDANFSNMGVYRM